MQGGRDVRAGHDLSRRRNVYVGAQLPARAAREAVVVWSLRRPDAARIAAHRAAQRELPFTYPGPGATRDDGPAPDGFAHDRHRVVVGRGASAFAAGREVIRRWDHFPGPLAVIEPAGVPIAQGEVPAIIVRTMGVYFLNAARIVYVIDEPRAFGFAYGTLPGHAESGEERFLVEWLPDDTVVYTIVAVSRPRYWMARLAKPIVRCLQRRFATRSMARVRELVDSDA
jgi:uncharacterized protein (UPF0548 family)